MLSGNHFAQRKEGEEMERDFRSEFKLQLRSLRECYVEQKQDAKLYMPYDPV